MRGQKMAEDHCEAKRIYGLYGRFARWLMRTFSPRYRCEFAAAEEPVVYVCRHLNMHGPYTTLKWLPMELHPMIIHVFFDRESTVRHLTEYTFATRYGKKARKFNLLAHVLGRIVPPLIHSLQGIPVYRCGIQSVTTIRTGLKYLLKNESLIVYPDIDYTDGYDQTSQIYDGFLYLGEQYYKKTGKQLAFVPLVIDDKNRTITAGDSIRITNYRTEGAAAAEQLRLAINKTAAAELAG